MYNTYINLKPQTLNAHGRTRTHAPPAGATGGISSHLGGISRGGGTLLLRLEGAMATGGRTVSVGVNPNP